MPHEAVEAVDRLKRSYEKKARQESLHAAIGAAYFSGLQWYSPQNSFRSGSLTAGGQHQLNYTPTSAQIRVMDNFTTQFTQLTEAGTFPIDLPVSVRPWDHDVNTGSVELSHIVRNLVEREKSIWGSVDAARYANFMSSIMGGYLIVLELAQEKSVIDGEEVPDWSLRWRTCPATDLLLDPANDMPNLRSHDEVCVRYVWSLRKLRRLYGIEIEPDNAAKIGELVPDYVKAAEISGGRLFKDYAQFSETKGVIIHQIHRKTDPLSKRFDKMHIVMDGVPGGQEYREPVVLNEEDDESPYGYDGLPITLINYFQRVGSPIGDGATHQIMSDQDRMNLSTTLYTLGLAHSAAPTWLIDTRGISREQFNQQIGNTIGGPLFYRGRPRTEGMEPPTSIRTADPSAGHLQVMDRIPESARNKVHRSALHLGQGKSHVPDVTTNRLLQESDKVLSRIVEQHSASYGDIVRVAIGTMRMALAKGSPSMLRRWVEDGFTEEQLVQFNKMDPIKLGLDITIPRESIRMRSPEEKKQEILAVMGSNNPILSNEESRYALATDAQSPLTTADSRLIAFASRSAERILAGQEWKAMPEVDHQMILYVFRQALYNYNGTDPEAKDRIQRAIGIQSEQRDKEIMKAQAMQQGGAEQQTQPTGVDLSALAEQV